MEDVCAAVHSYDYSIWNGHVFKPLPPPPDGRLHSQELAGIQSCTTLMRPNCKYLYVDGGQRAHLTQVHLPLTFSHCKAQTFEGNSLDCVGTLSLQPCGDPKRVSRKVLAEQITLRLQAMGVIMGQGGYKVLDVLSNDRLLDMLGGELSRGLAVRAQLGCLLLYVR